MIDRTKSSDVETSEAVERSKRSVIKDITPSTRKLTMPRIEDEEMMQTPDYFTGQYAHRNRGISMHSSGVLEEEQSCNDEAPGQDMEGYASESPIEGDHEDGEDNDEEPLEEEEEQSGSDTSTKATEELETEKQSYRNVPEEEIERNVLEATGEFEEEEDSNEEKPVQNVERSASEGLTVPTYYFDEEEQDSSEAEPVLKVERSTSNGLTVAAGESAEEKENSVEELEEELERRLQLESTGESEDDEGNDEEAVERSQTEESSGEVTGKLEEEDESNAEMSQEAIEQRALESHAVTTDARKEPEILSSPDIWFPEAMRRRRSSKITMISPVEKRKNSELKDSTPPARKLSMQRITDEGLIQFEEHFGEEEEADIGEEAQEEENQATAASFERTSYASPILGAAPSKHIQRKSSLEDIGNYLKSSNQNTHAQKMKRTIRGIKAGADTERSFKRRRLSANGQSKEAMDLDEIVPFYPDGDRTGPSNENRKDSVEAFISPATTPTKERVSPIISTGRPFVTRRKATKARTAPMPQTSSPLPELNIETAKKYPEADSDSEEFFNRLERTMTKLARKYILKIEDDTESFDSGVQEFERMLSLEDCLDSDDH